VLVAVEAGAQTVTVSVRDNGPGIEATDLDAIFQKFRQAGSTLTGKPQGTGLGLPISRQIIEHYGGQLWAESPPEGGAKFSFTLPISRQSADAAPDERFGEKP
jgi:signal transduction histidine kinase